MPYKHIAAHLRKTELACRLHYHQMSFGSNRRRRSESLSSIASSHNTPPSTSSEFSICERPVAIAPASPESQSSSPAHSISNSPNQPRSHIPILPKQMPSSSASFSPALPPIRSVSPEWIDAKQLRLDTSFTSQTRSRPWPSPPTSGEAEIDTARLHGLYNTHRDSFWSVIASEYSDNPEAFNGSRLEEAFFNAAIVQGSCFANSRKMITPPTPSASPRSSVRSLSRSSFCAGHSGFKAVNGPTLPSIAEPPTTTRSEERSSSAIEKCAVASLLTVEREVWAPKEISTA